MNNIKINGHVFSGPFYFDRNFTDTFACVYAIVENNNLIYISSGIGESYLKSRLFNPPEFIVFNIF